MCKKNSPRSDCSSSGSKLFDTLKEFFKNVEFDKKKSADNKQACKISQKQKSESITHISSRLVNSLQDYSLLV